MMLQKIYLVSPEKIQKCTGVKKCRKNKSSPERDFDKWIKISNNIREEDVKRKAQTKDIGKFLKNVLPDSPRPTVLPNFE